MNKCIKQGIFHAHNRHLGWFFFYIYTKKQYPEFVVLAWLPW